MNTSSPVSSLSVADFVDMQPLGGEFYLTKENLHVATVQEFHAMVWPFVEHGGGGFRIIRVERESQTGNRLISAVYAVRTS